MSIFDTEVFGSSLNKLKNGFHYGPHPSVFMWSTGEAAEESFTPEITKGLEQIRNDGMQSFTSFKFDAVVSEAHEGSSIVTAYPVSAGFDVEACSIKQDREIEIKAVATNMQNAAMWSASLSGVSVLSGAIFNQPLIPILGGVANTIASTFETSNRVQSTYELFLNLMRNGTRLHVSTIAGVYTNVVVTNLSTRHDKMNNSILEITIRLREVNTFEHSQVKQDAKKAMQSMNDYSEFAKIAQSMAVGVAGGAPLPGLGRIGDSPTKQLNALKQKLGRI